MRNFLFTFLTTTLLLSTNTFAFNKSEVGKNYTVVSIILIVEYGDGYFRLARKLFKALQIPESKVTWKDVLYVKELYQQKYETYDLKVGNEITILKSEFVE